MHKVKWFFFAYVAVCLLLVAAIGVSFAITRTRDPATFYGTYPGDIKTLDPADVGDEGAVELDGYVYECLYNYAYNTQPYKLIPELAEGDPEITSDGTTWTIHLKRGIHYYDPHKTVFSDGMGPEVTAEDVVYSWKRVCDFHLGTTANYAQMFQGRIVGIDDWFAYTQSRSSDRDIDWNRPVPGLTAADRYTLRIRLIDPFPQLAFNLALMPTAIVSRAAVEHWGERFKDHPIGTGPYAMAEHLPDQRIVYTANPLYRGGPDVRTGHQLPDGERMPHVKRVQLSAFQEPLPPWYLFLEGQLDASSLPKDTFGQAMAGNTGELSPRMEADGIKLLKYREPQVLYVGFNMLDPVVGTNKPLRQAMSLALDRQRYIDLYLNGRGVPANGPIPPGFPTYDPSRVAEFCRFDLASAKAKMAEAEKINGGPIPALHLLYGATTTAAAQEADFFSTCMRQIGLTVLTDFKPYGTFLSMIDRKQEQMFSTGWVADYPDEQDYWQLFYGKNSGQGGLNATNYSDAGFDALYDKTATLGPSSERARIYAAMQQMVLDDCPWIFIVYPVKYQLYHNWISNISLSDYGYGYTAERRLDFETRRTWLQQH